MPLYYKKNISLFISIIHFIIFFSSYCLLAHTKYPETLQYDKKIHAIIRNGEKIINQMNIKDSNFVLHALDITLDSQSKKLLYNALHFIFMIILCDFLIEKKSHDDIDYCQILENNLNPQNSFLAKIIEDNSFYIFILQAYIHIIISSYKQHHTKKRLLPFAHKYYDHIQTIILQKLFFYITGYHTNLATIMYCIASQLHTIYKQNQNQGISLLIQKIIRHCKYPNKNETHHHLMHYIFSSCSDDYHNY